jgi:hypothetical protein
MGYCQPALTPAREVYARTRRPGGERDKGTGKILPGYTYRVKGTPDAGVTSQGD